MTDKTKQILKTIGEVIGTYLVLTLLAICVISLLNGNAGFIARIFAALVAFALVIGGGIYVYCDITGKPLFQKSKPKGKKNNKRKATT